MALKNYQYNKILREYDMKQLKNKHDLDIRTEEVYRAIPELKEIDDTVVTCAVQSAKLLLMGENKPLTDLKKVTEEASAKRTALLIEHGYPVDYLQPAYHCPD